MKTVKNILSVIAVLMAVIFAFAFHAAPMAEDPARIDFSPSPDVCRRVPDIECGGGSEICEKDIGPPFGTVLIYNFDMTSDCNGLMRML